MTTDYQAALDAQPETKAKIDAFLADPSTGVRLERPLPRSSKEIAQEAKTFDITGSLADHWDVLESLRQQKIEIDRKFEAYKARFKEILEESEADIVTVNGRQVATHSVSGALNESRLRRELPHVWQAYSKEVVERKLDKEKLKELDPQTFENFRSRSLVFTDGAASH